MSTTTKTKCDFCGASIEGAGRLLSSLAGGGPFTVYDPTYKREDYCTECWGLAKAAMRRAKADQIMAPFIKKPGAAADVLKPAEPAETEPKKSKIAESASRIAAVVRKELALLIGGKP